MSPQSQNSAINAWNQYNQQLQQAITTNQFEKADIDLANDQFRSNFKNADYVDKLTTGVQDQYRLWTRDPSQIARNLWVSLDDVNLVTQWRGHEILQYTDSKLDELSKQYQWNTEDLNIQKARALKDYETTKSRVDQTYQWNMDDITKDYGLANQLTRKMGAGSGAILSSGYQEGMSIMKQTFDQTLSRLSINHDNDTYDLIENKTRLLEDFWKNIERLKYTHDKNIKENKNQALGVLTELRSKYQESDTNFIKSVQQIESNYLWNIQKIYEYDMWYMKDMQTMYNNEIDNMNKQQQSYMDMYAKDPALANAMYPWIGNQVQTQQALNQSIDTYWSSMTQNSGLQAGTTWLSNVLSKGKNWIRNQCWEVTNDYLKSLWDTSGHVGNSLDSKINTINSYTPVVWSVVIMDSPTNSKYGHTAIIQSIDANGNAILSDGNWFAKWVGWWVGSFKAQIKDGKIIVNWKEIQVHGYHVPTSIKEQWGWQNEWQKTYTPTQINIMKGMDAKELSTNELKVLKDAWLTANDIYNYKAGNTPALSDRQLENNYKTTYSSMEALRKEYYAQKWWYDTALSALRSWGKWAYTATVAFLKWLDWSVVKEWEYSAFTKAGIPLTDKVKTWINSQFTGDIPKSVQDKFESLINNLKQNSDRLYKQKSYNYADLIEANDPWSGVTILDPALRSSYKPWKNTPPWTVFDLVNIANQSIKSPKKNTKIKPLKWGTPR